MSLLSKASLVLTPNAVKESKLYSIIPSNGNGDMAVTRATTATRVNSEGFIEEVPYNLVKYSEMFSDVIWTKNNVSVNVNTITSPNNTLTADKIFEDTSDGSHRIFAGSTANIGTTYTQSIYAKAADRRYFSIKPESNSNAAVFDLQNGVIVSTTAGVTATITNVGNNWYRCTASKVSTVSIWNSLFNIQLDAVISSYVGNGISGIYIWGAQLVQGSVPKDYFPTTDRLNVPRLNYDVAGGCPSILLEPQRTNLALRSEEFDNASWVKTNATLISNTINSPNNSITGDSFDEGVVNGVHSTAIGITTTSGVNNTISVYIKKNTVNYVRLILNDNTITTSWVSVQFNLDTVSYTSGVGSTGGVFISASITSIDNSWYRCVLIGNIPITGAALFVISSSDGSAILSSDSRGRASYLGTGKIFYVWGAQAEVGAYPTSYIPTLASTVTRNADVISRNNIYTNGFITSAGGTWFVELNNNLRLIRDSGSRNLYLGDNSNGTGNGFSLINSVSNGNPARLSIFKSISSVTSPLFTTTTDTVKLAIKWNGSTADVFTNGVKVASATSFPTTVMELLLNINGGSQTSLLKSILLFPTPLSDSECIQLTTL